jgi:glutaredoxin 3
LQIHSKNILYLLIIFENDTKTFMLELILLMADLAPTPLISPIAIDQPHLQSIALYYSPRCPHSQRVLSYIRKHQLAIPLKNVLIDSQAKQQLKQIGGYSIVPCLIVNGAPIYNDGDIIEWLADHQDQLPKGNN